METAEEKKLRRRWDKLNEISGITIRRFKKNYILRVGKKITGGKIVATSSSSLERLVVKAEELYDLHNKTVDNKKSLTSAQALDASNALDLLNGKISLVDLAKKYLASLPSSKGITVKNLCDEFIDDREAIGRSDKYIYSLKNGFVPLCKWMGKKMTHEISEQDLTQYLNLNYKSKAPKTYNNHLITLKALWAFAVKKGYATKHVASPIQQKKVIPQEIKVFQPLDIQRLLETALKVTPDILIPLAIQAFSGLRRSEMGALKWEDIGDDHIVVKASIAKTSTRRTVPILPPLRALLNKVGRGCSNQLVYPKTDNAYRKRKDKVVKASGVQWVNNGLRHSFVTYRLIDTRDVNRTSLEAGHTAEMLHAHYRSLISDETRKTKEYWSMFCENTQALPLSKKDLKNSQVS